MKFAHFYGGLSHQFPADATVTDYLIAGRAANQLLRGRKYNEAMSAYIALTAAEKVSEFQKSDALQYAATCARNLRNYGRAEELAGQIPIDAVAKTVRMENRLAERKWTEVVQNFGEEVLSKWPFWQIGAGAFARAKAYVFMKQGAEAEADLQRALRYTPDTRIRTSILATMGSNRETNLMDDAGALAAYRLNYETKTRIGGADEFRSVERAAAILTKRGQFDAALAAIDVADVEIQTGSWRNAMLLARGDTLAAAGRNTEALVAYESVIADKTVEARHRKKAEESVRVVKSASGN